METRLDLQPDPNADVILLIPSNPAMRKGLFGLINKQKDMRVLHDAKFSDQVVAGLATRVAINGHWYRSYGNENWEFAENGLMRLRHASINDLPITDTERKFHWPLGRRPDDHPGLSELGL